MLIPRTQFRLLALAVLTASLAACGGGDQAGNGKTDLLGSSFSSSSIPSSVRLSSDPQSYTAGTILPNHLSQSQLDQQLVDFYQQWKKLYVTQDCGVGRYFINVDADHKFGSDGGSSGKALTVSEAHGYGMLISVMMANVDPDAKTIFDGMLAYFHDFPSKSGPGLMAWNQVVGCKNAKSGGDSATDGDLDIAYALLLADRQWGSSGTINYRQEAQIVLDAIMKHEVHPTGMHLTLGDASQLDKKFQYSTRTSDFMVSHLAAFAASTNDARWNTVRDRSYAIADAIHQNYSPQTALVPDFVVGLDTTPQPAKANFLESKDDGNYTWNASRYPWRVGLDYLLYGEPRALKSLAPLNAWARASTADQPAKFGSAYLLNGTLTKGGAGDRDELPFVSALGVSAMIQPENQLWLNAIWDDVQGHALSDGDYFGNTLKVLGMITMSGHWVRP